MSVEDLRLVVAIVIIVLCIGGVKITVHWK